MNESIELKKFTELKKKNQRSPSINSTILPIDQRCFQHKFARRQILLLNENFRERKLFKKFYPFGGG